MRRILVDRARTPQAEEGANLRATDLSESKLAAPAEDAEEMLAVHHALEELARRDPASARGGADRRTPKRTPKVLKRVRPSSDGVSLNCVENVTFLASNRAGKWSIPTLASNNLR